jgi:hypothetical protein
VLWAAWEQVRRNRGAAGVDGETIETIEGRGALEFGKRLRITVSGVACCRNSAWG